MNKKNEVKKIDYLLYNKIHKFSTCTRYSPIYRLNTSKCNDIVSSTKRLRLYYFHCNQRYINRIFFDLIDRTTGCGMETK